MIKKDQAQKLAHSLTHVPLLLTRMRFRSFALVER